MRNKYLAFIKNSGIAIGAMVAAGVGASELADYFSDNGKIIGAASTISQYIVGWSVFLPLQARDNRDVYTKNGKFNWKGFIWDNAKFAGSFALLDIGYLIGRPFLQDYFIDKGINSSNSSMLADSVFIPTYGAASVGLARLTGVIKPRKKNLEIKANENLK